MKNVIPLELLHRRIFIIRSHKVMLDSDLASLYCVKTKRLNEQVRRNRARFPHDFMFQLTVIEASALRSQFATLENHGRGHHRKYRPLVFTEQGVAMLSTVLNSERAIHVNIAIMRAFVRLRELVATHRKFAARLHALEQKSMEHDEKIQTILETIYELTTPARIGFKT